MYQYRYLQQDSSQPSEAGSTKHGLLASGLGLERVDTSNSAVGRRRAVVRGEGGLGSDGGLDTGGLEHGRSDGDIHVGDVGLGLLSSRSWSWGLGARSWSRGGGGRRRRGGGARSGGRKLGCRAHGGVDGLLAVDGGGEGGGHNLLFGGGGGHGGSGGHGGGALGERAHGGVHGLDAIDSFGHHGLGVGLHGGGASVVRAVGHGDVGGVVFSDGVDGGDGGLCRHHGSQTQDRENSVLHNEWMSRRRNEWKM